MTDKKIMLTVRATKDGTYGGYLWKGPIDSDQGYTPGEVFIIDATPYPVMDDKGHHAFELDEEGKKIPIMDAAGKQKKDSLGKKLFKMRMATFFSSEWMERVADDTELTWPERPAWKIPEAYKIRKTKPVRTVPLPADLQETVGLAIPSAVKELDAQEAKESVESVI